MDAATKPAVSSAYPTAVLAANRLLQQRREQLRAQRRAETHALGVAEEVSRSSGIEQRSVLRKAPSVIGAPEEQPRNLDRPRQKSSNVLGEDQSPASLPDHLGWQSERLTAVLRDTQRRRERAARQAAAQSLAWLSEAVGGCESAVEEEVPPTAANPKPAPIPKTSILISPDIAAALLRHELAGAGRVWLLLRHIDADGRGWIDVDEARAALSEKGSSLRVCGWRQLRNLLRDGQGVLWEQDGPAGDGSRNGARIWLRKPAKVAAALNVDRVGGRSVALPLKSLLGGIGEVRAQLYAAFHSGRVPGEGKARPIARETVARLTGVPRRTQIEYEERTGIKVQHNYAIGERATPAGIQERAWHQGGTFRLVDRKGKQGKENGEYIAWQMPNSYVGPYEQQSRQRTRRINQDLADLRIQGGVGNGQGQIDKLYFEHGAAAGKAYNRDGSKDAYWPYRQGRNRTRLWFVISRQE